MSVGRVTQAVSRITMARTVEAVAGDIEPTTASVMVAMAREACERKSPSMLMGVTRTSVVRIAQSSSIAVSMETIVQSSTDHHLDRRIV